MTQPTHEDKNEQNRTRQGTLYKQETFDGDHFDPERLPHPPPRDPSKILAWAEKTTPPQVLKFRNCGLDLRELAKDEERKLTNGLAKKVTNRPHCVPCNEFLVLRNSRHGIFWGCPNWPECDTLVGAHAKSGEPLGIPANKNTRNARVEAHKQFDLLWKGPESHMSRNGAYGWLQRVMKLPPDEAHIGRFDMSQCKALIGFVHDELVQEVSK